MPKVPELKPSDVGTPVPVAGQVPPETYTYDYIIIGGGTSGCVLASRLSEDPDVSVLVIERGPVADTWASRVPVISINPFRKDSVASLWWSLPLHGADSRYVEVMCGEALGGTSRMNGLLYTRGTPGDYNQWKALGNEGWGYDDLEPYFIKSEGTRIRTTSPFRGNNGLWQTTRTADPFKTNSLYVKYTASGLGLILTHENVSFVRALGRLGIEQVNDLNAPDAPAACIGVLDYVKDTNHHRHSTFSAFLSPQLAQQRKARLKICPDTLVTSVELFKEADKVYATGVHFEATSARQAGQHFYARARKEIILCAGALGSPQILMLSGIGPKQHLLEKGVSVVRDLPAVGSHLQDHIGVPITFEVPMSHSIHQLETNPLKALLEVIKYVFTGGGLLSQPFHNISTFVPTRLLDDSGVLSPKEPRDLDASIPDNRPDIEFIHIPCNCTDNDIPGKGIYTLMPALIRPKSEGTVRLATGNPRARPDVDLGFLTNTEDYVPLRKGVKMALRVCEDVRQQGYPLEDLSVPDGKSDEDIDRFIRANLRTCYHYTSTCRMGAEPHGARPSVVDTELRVHGVGGLRVCDASVFPEIIGSHTMAPAVMVAEKCADLIRGRCATGS